MALNIDFNRYLDQILDTGYVPHRIIRLGIRRLLIQRAGTIRKQNATLTAAHEYKQAYISRLRSLPIAIHTDAANTQHYEVGPGVLQACLGPQMKYSCCLYPTGRETLGQAEEAMLELYIKRADLHDGQAILDLGCGWGSASLFLAKRFPGSGVTAFSNSAGQRRWIEARAKEQGLDNLQVVTGDVVNYDFAEGAYDRVVSIELFEHMKNYEKLMAKVARALKPGGKLFVHIFAHRDSPYDFEDGDGWMSEHFFTGGTMPSADLLLYFQRDLSIREMWWVNGKHYAKTCEDWLSKMTSHRNDIWPHLSETYGAENATMWYSRWQIFYMACAELFAYEGGETWGVCHYLFEKPETRVL